MNIQIPKCSSLHCQLRLGPGLFASVNSKILERLKGISISLCCWLVYTSWGWNRICSGFWVQSMFSRKSKDRDWLTISVCQGLYQVRLGFRLLTDRAAGRGALRAAAAALQDRQCLSPQHAAFVPSLFLPAGLTGGSALTSIKTSIRYS